MTAIWLAAGMLLILSAFVAGAWVGGRNMALLRIQVFRDLDNLIGLVREVTALTNDKRIAPEVVIDALAEAKYGLRLPSWVERQEDHNPVY